MIERTTNTCPYCKKTLAKVPTSKRNCSDCGKLIRPRQGFLYTEANFERLDQREAEAPSKNQLAFMVCLGIDIPRGCTADHASRLIDKAKPADTPSDAERQAYKKVLNEIIERMKGTKELVDDIIENPPQRPRIEKPAAAGCSTVLVGIALTLYLFS